MAEISLIVSNFMIGYTTLISIINPFGLAFIFYDMTRQLNDAQRKAVSLRIAMYSFSVLIVASLLGSVILNFFGISLAALRIAGGLAVAFAGWSLLNKPDGDTSEIVAPQRSAAAVAAMAFYPLTMPLTTGPGSVAAAIALVVNRRNVEERIVSVILEAIAIGLAVSLTIYVCYRWSGWLSEHLGVAATRIFTRVAAFLLLCVGVQIIITGVVDVIRSASA